MQSTRKKILYLITKSNWGGAQRYVYDLATTLDPASFEPVVILGGTGELTQKLESAGVRTITLQTLQRDISVSKEIGFMTELWRIIRIEKPDVLHVNSSKAGGVGCFIGRLARVPRVIFTAHGWAFNEDRPMWQKFIIKKAHWWTVLLSHQTIAVSNAIISQMNWPLTQRKMIVINPGRTIPEFQSRLTSRTTFALQYPPLAPYTADVWLCILAELHPIKQHQVLFTVLKSIVVDFPNVRLICVGDGELRAKLTNYVEEHNLTKHIFLVGPIHEAASLLKAADMFVLPSKSESYGYVLHEAGLARVPIIASNVGGITDIISNEHEGTLINPTDPAALEAALRDFLRAPHTYNDKTQKLQSKLTDRTVDAMTAQTIEVYKTS
ncbi:MAG: glycosyltransferase involved in cell wall biosynthesis [Candidatus Paceibacteria bacterium]|jgi:glycosyltransferase involved in cell wall biosynthesis